MESGSRVLAAALAGAVCSLAFWAADLLTLRQLLFAGVGDAAAEQRLMEEARTAVFRLEARLFALHLVLGAALGMVAAVAAGPLGLRRRRVTAAVGTVVAAFVLLLAGMVTRYPQVYADRWWLGGGFAAAVQRALTHATSPLLWDALLLLLLATLAVGLVASLRRPVVQWAARRAPVAAASLLALAIAQMPVAQTRPRGTAAAPDVLLLVGDSLRADRLESAAVMPFTSGLVRRGTYFPHAFTSVARTLPSWASLLTGLEPRAHGVTTMFPDDHTMNALGPTLFEELRDRGYFTFAVSDFAGDFFPRVPGSFDAVDTPHFTIDTLASSTVLAAHRWSLPLLRSSLVRRVLPEWRNMPGLSDPRWLADRAWAQIGAAGRRPYAGVVFFSNGHFPFSAPHPHYLRDSGGYRGRFLYHVPPLAGDDDPSTEDMTQIRARYDGAFAAIDAAIAGLVRELDRSGRLSSTVLIVTGDHGEQLYERDGIAGHGDTLGFESQSVPIAVLGPGVAARVVRSQVRLLDVPATVLDLLPGAARPARFGDGVSLLSSTEPRPLCVETGLWFWPDRPRGLNGHRLTYSPVTQLLDLDRRSRHLALRADQYQRVETAKDRGIVLGNRLWHQRPTPDGLERSEERYAAIEEGDRGQDLRELFDRRCVQGNPRLAWLHGAVVARPPHAASAVP